jgi:hypothetical protein
VDPADYYRLRKYEWAAQTIGKSCYARRYTAGGKRSRGSLVYLHQEIIKVPDGMVADHINHDGMDNRSANLRAATRAQNMRNRKKYARTCSSRYKGVHWYKQYSKWTAKIRFDNKRIFLGYFEDEVEAARAYDRAAMKYHGEFASLNFPDKAGVLHRRKRPNSF